MTQAVACWSSTVCKLTLQTEIDHTQLDMHKCKTAASLLSNNDVTSISSLPKCFKLPPEMSVLEATSMYLQCCLAPINTCNSWKNQTKNKEGKGSKHDIIGTCEVMPHQKLEYAALDSSIGATMVLFSLISFHSTSGLVSRLSQSATCRQEKREY